MTSDKKILFVHAKGGVPLEHAIPRMAACAELHVLTLAPLPARTPWRSACTQIIDSSTEPVRGEPLVDLVVSHARRIGADAVLGFSEYVLLAVSLAAERLSLPGPGASVRNARDKRLMREVWYRAGVPVPAFRRVGSEADLAAASTELTAPMLVKPAWGAGSVGQGIISSPADVPRVWRSVTAALNELSGYGLGELYEPGAAGHLLVEEIIEGTAAGWYTEDGYGDYLSVEGIVAAGTFHPLAITGRIPTIPPFTELSSHAPCVLPEPLQRHVEQAARAAVDALGLDTCGTHTEFKLGPHGRLTVLESAARFGGSAITEVVETVHGVDMVTMLTRQLLGEPVSYPDRMLVDATTAAAELSLIATDSAGRPWRSSPVWDSCAARLDPLVSPGSQVRPVTGLTVPDGTPVPPYDTARGITNCFGMLFLTAPDPRQLLADTYALLDGLEGQLLATPEPAAAGSRR